MATRKPLPALKPRPARPVTTVPLAVRQQPAPARPAVGNVNPAASPFPWKQKAKPARPYTNIDGTPRKRSWWNECSKIVAGQIPSGRSPGGKVSPIEISSVFSKYWREAGTNRNLKDGPKCKEAINRLNQDGRFGRNFQFHDAPDFYGPTDPQNMQQFVKSSRAPAKPAAQAVPPRVRQFQAQQGEFDQLERELEEMELANLERELEQMRLNVLRQPSPPLSPRGSPQPSPPSTPPLLRRQRPTVAPGAPVRSGRALPALPPRSPSPVRQLLEDFDLPDLPPPPELNLGEDIFAGFDFRNLPLPPRR